MITDDKPVQGQTHSNDNTICNSSLQTAPLSGGDHRHCVWLYFRFSLSYHDVQETMAERGVIVSHEAVRYWGRKFGQAYANQLRRRRSRPGDKWHMDEAFLTINGARSDLWRAVDQDDNVLDVLMQSRRNKKAAKKFFKNKYNCSIRSWGSMRPGRCCLPTLPSG